MKKTLSIFFCILLIATFSIPMLSHAAVVTVSVQANSAYNRLELATITGQLAQDGSPVANGLVAIQITSPTNNVLSLRTSNTGGNPASQIATIQSVYLSDSEGNQLNTAATGSLGYFQATAINNDQQARNVLIAITIYDNFNSPIGFAGTLTTMQPRETTHVIIGIPIQSSAATGMARVFAGVYSNYINFGGLPYSTESSSTFGIDTQDGTAPPSTQVGNQGNYTLQMKMPINVVIGTYTILASSSINGFSAFSSSTFNVNQGGDFNGDGKIDINDVTTFVVAYINYWNNKPFNPLADLDHNGVINVNDITLFCYAYIQYWSWQ